MGMGMASPSPIHELRPRILERRVRLQRAARTLSAEYVHDLLAEVDAALERIDNGSYGRCQNCGDPIEEDRLTRNPLERFCLDHLSAVELRAHEQDLALATQIQGGLLPRRDFTSRGWQTHFRYAPAGVVGGDYCEIAPSTDGSSLFFALGDVAGKGVAASLLMTHLNAIFRSLLSLDLPLSEIVVRANRLFCDGTPASHFATIVAGRATADGVELCNAGHCPPLVVRREATDRIEATGLPLGLFCEGRYSIQDVRLEPGDSLVMYSDGLTEALDAAGNHYEEARLARALRDSAERDPIAMAEAVLRDVALFRRDWPLQDDMALLILRRR